MSVLLISEGSWSPAGLPEPGAAPSTADELLPCHRVDPDLFFAERPADVERAKAVCAGCPVRTQCLAGALSRGEPWGVWGGQLFQDGAVIRFKRGRGRPPKNAPQPYVA